MPIAFRGTPKIGSASNGGDVVLTFDTGAGAPLEGDVIFLFGGRGNSSDATAWGPITSGYTPILVIDSTGPKFGVWYKVVGPITDLNVQGEGGASTAHGVVYGAYVIDGSTIDPVIFDQTSVSTGQQTAWVPNGPAIVTQTAGAWVITHAACSLNDTSRGLVSGYTLIPGASVNETDDFVSEAAYKEVASPGSDDPPAWSTWSSGIGGAITIALRPSAGTTYPQSFTESWSASESLIADSILTFGQVLTETWQASESFVADAVVTIKYSLTETWQAVESLVADAVITVTKSITETWQAAESFVTKFVKMALFSETWQAAEAFVTQFVVASLSAGLGLLRRIFGKQS